MLKPKYIKKPEEMRCMNCIYSQETIRHPKTMDDHNCHRYPTSLSVEANYSCGEGQWLLEPVDNDRNNPYLADWHDQFRAEVWEEPEPPRPKKDAYMDLYHLGVQQQEKAILLLKDMQEEWKPGPVRERLQKIVDVLEGEDDD